MKNFAQWSDFLGNRQLVEETLDSAGLVDFCVEYEINPEDIFNEAFWDRFRTRQPQAAMGAQNPGGTNLSQKPGVGDMGKTIRTDKQQVIWQKFEKVKQYVATQIAQEMNAMVKRLEGAAKDPWTHSVIHALLDHIKGHIKAVKNKVISAKGEFGKGKKIVNKTDDFNQRQYVDDYKDLVS